MTRQDANTKIRYFAWVRSRLDRAEDTIAVPAGGTNLRDIAKQLQSLSDAHGVIFERPEVLKVAINKEYADLDDAVQPGDEVAFFPPVTGG